MRPPPDESKLAINSVDSPSIVGKDGPHSDRPHVLVVDDREDIRQVVTEMLREAGYRASSASSGVEVRAFLQRKRSDVILLDVVLRGENGFSLARYASELGIPVLMMSGHPHSLEALREGDLPFIAKPFRIGDLVAAIQAVQEQSRRVATGQSVPGRRPRARLSGPFRWVDRVTARRSMLWRRHTTPTARRIAAGRVR